MKTPRGRNELLETPDEGLLLLVEGFCQRKFCICYQPSLVQSRDSQVFFPRSYIPTHTTTVTAPSQNTWRPVSPSLARKRGRRVVLLQEKGDEAMEECVENCVFRQRIVNVINEGNMDERFSNKGAKSLMRGKYEEWTTNSMCSLGGHHGVLRFAFTNSVSGMMLQRGAGGETTLQFVKARICVEAR